MTKSQAQRQPHASNAQIIMKNRAGAHNIKSAICATTSLSTTRNNGLKPCIKLSRPRATQFREFRECRLGHTPAPEVASGVPICQKKKTPCLTRRHVPILSLQNYNMGMIAAAQRRSRGGLSAFLRSTSHGGPCGAGRNPSCGLCKSRK